MKYSISIILCVYICIIHSFALITENRCHSHTLSLSLSRHSSKFHHSPVHFLFNAYLAISHNLGEHLKPTSSHTHTYIPHCIYQPSIAHPVSITRTYTRDTYHQIFTRLANYLGSSSHICIYTPRRRKPSSRRSKYLSLSRLHLLSLYPRTRFFFPAEFPSSHIHSRKSSINPVRSSRVP